MDYPRPLAVGSAIAVAIRPFYALWLCVPVVPVFFAGIRERARKKATEAILLLLIQSAVRALL